MHILNILSDNSEVVPYNITSLPLYAMEERASHYPGMTGAMHWHNDLEFILITSGQMVYTVNTENFILKEGDGIFINSQQLHGHHAINNQECIFIGVLIPIQLLNFHRTLEEKYVNSFCYNSEYSYILLKNNTDYQKQIWEYTYKIYELCNNGGRGFEIDVLSHIYALFHCLINNADFVIQNKKTENPWIDNLHQMIGFIQKNFADKISLQDIAESGNVCRSKCCEIFKQLMHQTPNEYLTYHRITKSMELLTSTSLSMTDIALECGFSGSSYFTETFRKVMGCTPSQYRKKKAD